MVIVEYLDLEKRKEEEKTDPIRVQQKTLGGGLPMSRNKNNKIRIKAILEEGPKTTGQIMTRLKDDESTRGTRKITVNGKIIGYKKVKRSNRRLDAPNYESTV